MRLAVPSLPQRVEANAESAAEEPYDADGYPAGEEFLAEDISGAVHGHWPELEAISLCSHTCCRVTATWTGNPRVDVDCSTSVDHGIKDELTTSNAKVNTPVTVFAINDARFSLVFSAKSSSSSTSAAPGISSRSTFARAATSESSPRRISAMDTQSYFCVPNAYVNTGTKINGESKATTLPASMGLLPPVLSTERLPDSLLAVTSQAIREQTRPRIGDKVAATMFCPDQRRVRAAGKTAEDMMTPIIR